MTLALAFASRNADPNLCRIMVMADSRVTFRDRANRRQLDNFIKTVSLGTRSAAVAAGDTTPFLMAVEAARPFITWGEHHRASNHLPPLSLWSQAALVARHLNTIFGEFQDVFRDDGIREVTILIVGFFSDNTPGIVRVEHREVRKEATDRSYADISVWRPRVGERAYAVGGSVAYAPIIAESIRRSKPPAGKGYNEFGSVLWDAIKHEGTPTNGIGGGLAFGTARPDGPLFEWRPIEIEGNVFVRGLRYANPIPGDQRVKVDYDPALFSVLEREHAEIPFTSLSSPSDMHVTGESVVHGEHRLFTASGDERLLAIELDNDDTWLLNELDTTESEEVVEK